MVWKLDRYGRSLRDLIDGVNALKVRKVGFRSLQEAIDTTTSGGRLIFHVFASLAEFERDRLRERTQAGLQAARARGRMGGRPRALEGKRLDLARSLFRDPKNAARDIAKTLGISLATLYRYAGSSPVLAPSTTPAVERPTTTKSPRREEAGDEAPGRDEAGGEARLEEPGGEAVAALTAVGPLEKIVGIFSVTP